MESLNFFGTAMSMVVTSFKYIYILYYRKKFMDLIDFGRNLFFEGGFKEFFIVKKPTTYNFKNLYIQITNVMKTIIN